MNRFLAKKLEYFPHRSTKASAGYDFVAPYDFVIPAHGLSECIDTGVSVELDEDKVLLCFIRSSLGFKKQITLVNNTGIIDADFCPNTIKAILRNDSDEDVVIKKGDRFMQGLIMNYYLTDDDYTTDTRNGGIGSTGR